MVRPLLKAIIPEAERPVAKDIIPARFGLGTIPVIKAPGRAEVDTPAEACLPTCAATALAEARKTLTFTKARWADGEVGSKIELWAAVLAMILWAAQAQVRRVSTPRPNTPF
jgi:hypothetical protein